MDGFAANAKAEGALAFCDSDSSVFLVLELFTFITVSKFMILIWDGNTKLMQYVLYVPTRDENCSYFAVTDPQDKNRKIVTHASPMIKITVALFVLLPKVAVNVYAAFIALKFMALAGSPYGVMLKCLGIGLISSIP